MAVQLNLCRLCRWIRPLVSPAGLGIRAHSSNKKLEFPKKQNGETEKLSCIPMTFDDELRKWRKLLQLEITTEIEKTRELVTRGIAIGDLSLVSESYSPTLGRVVDLESRNSSGAFRHFRSGTPLVLCIGSGLEWVTECVLLSLSRNRLQVQIRGDRAPLLNSIQNYALIPSATAAALQPIDDFLSKAKRLKTFPGYSLLLYAYRALPLPLVHNDRRLRYISQDLNEDQKRAVDASMNKKRPIVIIHGPPGTGKTVVITEIILQAVKSKQKVLVCAPTHLAVDNILDRVCDKVRACRIGVDADADGSLSSYVKADPQYDDLVRLTKDMNELWEVSQDTEVFRKLKRKAASLRQNIEMNILKNRDAVFSTLLSGKLRRLYDCGYRPDLIVVDEVAQAFECVSWMPIMFAKRCVLAGDHRQLSSVLQSSEAKKDGLGISVMEALHKKFGSLISQLLSVQYRMNEKIMKWSSDYFYGGKLVADSSVANRTLSDICEISPQSIFNEPVLMFDTYSSDGGSMKEEFYKMSYLNFGEADIVSDYVDFLKKSGINEKDIGVITPYHAQVECLQQRVNPDIVRSVDGFQGQQRETIVMSLVRDNDPGFVSLFL